MSLILDALRKADAERERGAVPGLHAQPVPPLSVEPEPAQEARPVVWIVIGAIVGLASAFAVYFAGREPPPAPPPPVAQTPAIVEPAPAAAAAAVAESATPRAAAPLAVPAPWPGSEIRSTGRPAPPATAHAASKPQTPAPPPIPRDQLPADIRAELPPLAIGGSMYSTTPANRTLIVDGRLYREGDRVVAGLTLEEIRLKSAVFGYKGHRFEVRF